LCLYNTILPFCHQKCFETQLGVSLNDKKTYLKSDGWTQLVNLAATPDIILDGIHRICPSLQRAPEELINGTAEGSVIIYVFLSPTILDRPLLILLESINI
jgi:hypothetical protein